MPSKNRLLEAALKYANVLGWPVLPLKGKIPLTAHGSKDATIKQAQITEWWKRWPQANVGLATAHKFWVLDVDTKNGGDLSLDQLEAKYGRLPSTIQQLTGTGGRHYLFQLPNFKIGNSESLIAPGLDVRGEGGYIVGAPSIHPLSGKPYIWDGVDSILKQSLLPAPDWLLSALRNGARNRNGIDQLVPDKLPKGKQHKYLVSIAGSMRHRGLEFPEIFAAIQKINELRCTEPGPIENIRQIAESVCRYPAGKVASGEREKAPNGFFIEEAGPEIYSGAYQEPEAIIDPILYPGLTLLAGKSKLGKSWFTTQLALAVSGQTRLAEFFEVVKPGRVLYLSLEENRRQTKKRLRMLMPQMSDFLQNVHYVYQAPPLLAGGAAALDAHLETHPAEVVIIDSLLAFLQTSGARKTTDVMQADYNVVNTLRGIAEKYKLALIVVAHTRKAPGDAIDTVQGTMGLVAAADAVWVMSRDSQGNVLLTVTGRDVYSTVFGLKQGRDSGWKVTGEGDEIQQGMERREILDLLRENGPMKAVTISRTLHKGMSATWNLLNKLAEQNLVVRTKYGTYRISNQQDPSSPV